MTVALLTKSSRAKKGKILRKKGCEDMADGYFSPKSGADPLDSFRENWFYRRTDGRRLHSP